MGTKVLIIIFILLLSGVTALFIFNSRYPFVAPEGGSWSVGFQRSDNPLEERKLAPEKIITYEYIESLLSKLVDYIADPFFYKRKEKDSFYLLVEIKGRGNANIALLTIF